MNRVPYVKESEFNRIVEALQEEYAQADDFVVGFSGYEPFVTPNCVKPKAGLLVPFFENLSREIGRPLRYQKSTWEEFPRLIQDRQLDTMLEPIIHRPECVVIPYMEMVCNVLVVPAGRARLVEEIARNIRALADELTACRISHDVYNMRIPEMFGAIAAMSKDQRIGVTTGVLEQRILSEFGVAVETYPPEDIVANVRKALPNGQVFCADLHSALIARRQLVKDKNFQTRIVHPFRDRFAECGFAASYTNQALARYFVYTCKYRLSEVHELLKATPDRNSFDGNEFRLLEGADTRECPITRYSHRDMVEVSDGRRARRLPPGVVLVPAAPQLPAPIEFGVNQVVMSLRRRWESSTVHGRAFQVGLAVLHGIVERMVGRTQIDYAVRQFLAAKMEQTNAGVLDPVSIENEGKSLGLPVCEPQEEVTAVDAYFGYVASVVENKARVLLLDDTDQQILDDMTVPCNWLPVGYRSEGAGVAWVERHYVSGSRGRFEPGSGDDIDESA